MGNYQHWNIVELFPALRVCCLYPYSPFKSERIEARGFGLEMCSSQSVGNNQFNRTIIVISRTMSSYTAKQHTQDQPPQYVREKLFCGAKVFWKIKASCNTWRVNRIGKCHGHSVLAQIFGERLDVHPRMALI